MLNSTRDAIRATIKAVSALDPSVSASQVTTAVSAAIAALSGEGLRETHGESPPRAYSPAQVAELLGRSRRTVTLYARRGLLVPIYSGETGARAQGYTGESVAALLSGRATAKGKAVAV